MSESQTNLAWDTLLELGEGRRGPLHARLSGAIREAIRGGRLPPAAPCRPAASWPRTWAARAGSSPRPTRSWPPRAMSRPGSAPGPGCDPSAGRPPPTGGRGPAGPGAPASTWPWPADLRAFPLGRWVAALRSVAGTLPYAELGYPDRRPPPAPAGPGRVPGAGARRRRRPGAGDGVPGRHRRDQPRRQACGPAGITAVAVEDPGWHKLPRPPPGPGCGSCRPASTATGCGSATSTPTRRCARSS